jgi:hypothetical protein
MPWTQPLFALAAKLIEINPRAQDEV